MPQVSSDVAGGDQTVANLAADNVVTVLALGVSLIAPLFQVPAVTGSTVGDAQLQAHQVGVGVGHGIGAENAVLLPNLNVLHEVHEVFGLVVVLNLGAVQRIGQNAQEQGVAQVVDILGNPVGFNGAGNVVSIGVGSLQLQHDIGDLVQSINAGPVDVGVLGIGLLDQVQHGRGVGSDGGQCVVLAVDLAAFQNFGIVSEQFQNLGMSVQQLGHVSQLAVGMQGSQGHIPEGREDVDGVLTAGEQQVELGLHAAEVNGNQVDLSLCDFAQDLVHCFLDVGLVVGSEHSGVSHADNRVSAVIVVLRLISAVGGLAGVISGLAGAGSDAQHHNQDQQQGDDLFHKSSPYCIFYPAYRDA